MVIHIDCTNAICEHDGHIWVPAGGGMMICAACEAMKESDQ